MVQLMFPTEDLLPSIFIFIKGFVLTSSRKSTLCSLGAKFKIPFVFTIYVFFCVFLLI